MSVRTDAANGARVAGLPERARTYVVQWRCTHEYREPMCDTDQLWCPECGKLTPYGPTPTQMLILCLLLSPLLLIAAVISWSRQVLQNWSL